MGKNKIIAFTVIVLVMLSAFLMRTIEANKAPEEGFVFDKSFSQENGFSMKILKN